MKIVRELYTFDIRRPWRKIVGPINMYVIADHNNKYIWAEDMQTKKRGIIGTSAFYTFASAKSAQHGRLLKLEQTRFVMVRYPHLRSRVKLALSSF